MKLKAFRKEWNGAPCDVMEFAQAASKVSDCPALRATGQELLEAESSFMFQLTHVKVSIG
jgi:hypothetical protein